MKFNTKITEISIRKVNRRNTTKNILGVFSPLLILSLFGFERIPKKIVIYM